MRINRWICAAAAVGAAAWSLAGATAHAQERQADVIVAAPAEDVLYVASEAQASAEATSEASAEGTEDVLIQVDNPPGGGQFHVEELNVVAGEGAPTSKYWIGVMCQPVDEPLRAHLKLDDGAGVIVGEVVPDSPAAKANLKKYDIIVSVGDAKVSDAVALMKAVDGAGTKELTLHVIRAGEPTTLVVTPAERKQEAVPAGEEVRTARITSLLRRFHDAGQGPVMRLFHPGAVAPPPPAMPENLNIRIEKHGNEPAKIHVEQDGKTWDVTENELGDLPENLRGHIGRMIGHGGAPIHFRLPQGAQQGQPQQFQIEVVSPPGDPGPVAGERVRALRQRVEGEGGERLEQRLDQLNERLDRLQELIDRLQRPEPKQESAPPTP